MSEQMIIEMDTEGDRDGEESTTTTTGSKKRKKKNTGIGSKIKSKKAKFKPAYTNRKVAKDLTNSGHYELSRDELSCMSEEEKLFLNVWGLPPSVVARYAAKGVTTLFPWQLECLGNEKVLSGRNLLYSAPTSAGKTLVAEIIMLKRVIELGKKAIMILPFVSVCREKMYSLQEIFGDAGVRVEGFMGSYSPPGGFKAVDIAICTIEKANSLINRLLEEKSISQLGTIVVDELHLIGDPHRGYLLELLLTKIRYMTMTSSANADLELDSMNTMNTMCSSVTEGQQKKLNIQIIGMSATLPNLSMLSSWLDAELVVSEYRPVPLVERISFDEVIADQSLLPVREVKLPTLPVYIQGDEGNLIYLSLETVLGGHSVLIFCPSKLKCEKLAVKIAREFFLLGSNYETHKCPEATQKIREQLGAERIQEVYDQLKDCPAGIDDKLKQSVRFGVGFHHAGLTYDERDIIESAFKRGVLRVICATSTLSAGVNLPARRVIITTPKFNRYGLDVLTYKQMCGRAGRKGVDTHGESILLCTDDTKDMGVKLVKASLPPVRSALLGDLQAPKKGDIHKLPSSMKRALLEVIASKIASSPSEVESYAKCTLLTKSIESGMYDEKELGTTLRKENIIEECLKFLVEKDFVVLQKLEAEGSPDKYVPTKLGDACLASSLAPDEGITVYKELQKARKCFVLESELHVVYQVTPIFLSEQLRTLPWRAFGDIYDDLSLEDKKVGGLAGVNLSFIISAASTDGFGDVSALSPKLQEKVMIHQRFYAALALNDLVNEMPITEVANKYGLEKGVIQGLQQSASTFAGMVGAFCSKLGWSNLELLLGQFQERMQFGVQRVLCDLVRLSTMNGQRARILYNGGITTIAELATADPAFVENIFHGAIPFVSEVHGGQRPGGKVWIMGKNELLTEAEAAKKIVEEARQFIQMELGLPENVQFGANLGERKAEDQLSQENPPNDPQNKSLSRATQSVVRSQFIRESQANSVDILGATEPSLNSSKERREKLQGISTTLNQNQSQFKSAASVLPEKTAACSKSNGLHKEIQNLPSSQKMSQSQLLLNSSQEHEECEELFQPSDPSRLEIEDVEPEPVGVNPSPIRNQAQIHSQTNNDSVFDDSFAYHSQDLFADQEEEENVQIDLDSDSDDVLTQFPAGSKPDGEPGPESQQQQNNNLDEDEIMEAIQDQNVSGHMQNIYHEIVENAIKISQPQTNKNNRGQQMNGRVEISGRTSPDPTNQTNSPRVKHSTPIIHHDYVTDFKKRLVHKDRDFSIISSIRSPILNGNNNGMFHRVTPPSFGSFRNLNNNNFNCSGGNWSSEFNADLLAEFEKSFDSKSEANNDSASAFGLGGLGSGVVDIIPSSSLPIQEKLLSDSDRLAMEQMAKEDSKFSISISVSNNQGCESEDLFPEADVHEGSTLWINNNVPPGGRKTTETKVEVEEDDDMTQFPGILEPEVLEEQEVQVLEVVEKNNKINRNEKTAKSQDMFADDSILFTVEAIEAEAAISGSSGNSRVEEGDEQVEQISNGEASASTSGSSNSSAFEFGTYSCETVAGQTFKIRKVAERDLSPGFTFGVDVTKPIGFGIKLIPSTKSRGIGAYIRPTDKRKNLEEHSIALFNGGDAIWQFKWTPSDSPLPRRSALSNFLEKIKSTGCPIVLLNSKNKLKKLLETCGSAIACNLPDKIWDPKISQWMLKFDESKDQSTQVGSGKLKRWYLNETEGRVTSFKAWKKDDDIREALTAFYLIGKIKEKLDEQNLWKPFTEIEMPATLPLMYMELNGFKLNNSELLRTKRVLEYKQALLKIRAYELAGRYFNLTATKEIEKILFSKELGLKRPKDSSGNVITGTSEKVLSKLDHELPRIIVSFRKIDNALTKMVKQFEEFKTRGRVVGTYDFFTSNGRVAMGEPSLQLVPRDFDLEVEFTPDQVEDLKQNCVSKFGSKYASLIMQIERGVSASQEKVDMISMRNVFVSSAGYCIVAADYSQLELRILAHLSEDAALLSLLNQEGGDVFVAIASKWKKLPPHEVTPKIRQEAKGIVYGVIYGMGARTLSEQMKVGEQEAKAFIKEFYEAYPGVQDFIKETHKSVKEKKYIQTMCGRRRYLPNIDGPSPKDISQAERVAVNSKIQGSASELVKTAMGRIHASLNKKNNCIPLDAESTMNSNCCTKKPVYFPILNLHDELIFEVSKSKRNEIAKEIKLQMETSLKLKVRLPVVIKTGDSWGNLSVLNL